MQTRRKSHAWRALRYDPPIPKKIQNQRKSYAPGFTTLSDDEVQEKTAPVKEVTANKCQAKKGCGKSSAATDKCQTRKASCKGGTAKAKAPKVSPSKKTTAMKTAKGVTAKTKTPKKPPPKKATAKNAEKATAKMPASKNNRSGQEKGKIVTMDNDSDEG